MDSGAPTSIKLKLTPHTKDLGAFEVKRAIPQARMRAIGPWVFFDHFGPAELGPGEGMNVRPHPHIGIATVTYLFEGRIHHRDSLGSDQGIEPGAVNLMVCGSGMVHSERTYPDDFHGTYRMHGLQLWHALPDDEEDRHASFHHYASGDIPETRLDGGAVVRVMMGEAFGLRSPVRTFSDILYYEVTLPAGASVTLPGAAEHALYCVDGSVEIDAEPSDRFTMSVMSAGPHTVTARTDARFAVIGGAPLGERHIRWNFVSSDIRKIERAAERWRAGDFPTVPGDATEFIPLPEKMVF